MSKEPYCREYFFNFKRKMDNIELKDTISAVEGMNVSQLISKVKESTQLRLYSTSCSVIIKNFCNQEVDPFETITTLWKKLQNESEVDRVLTVEVYILPRSKRLKVTDSNYLDLKQIEKVTSLLDFHGLYSVADTLETYSLIRSNSVKDWHDIVKNEQLSAELYSILHETNFDKSRYSLKFLSENTGNKTYTPLLDRDDAVKQVNEIASRCPSKRTPKFNPLVMCGSRGMGKTYFMESIALQNLIESLKCQPIAEARDCGRAISFDFLQYTVKISNEKEAETFLKHLLIYYLCETFNESYVDGIFFQAISFYAVLEHDKLTNEHLKRMIPFWLGKSFDDMMAEYMRLTNIAFKVDCHVPPVFFFDEIQEISQPTDIQSAHGHFHTSLSLLLKTISIPAYLLMQWP
jgi:hypothetical protein